MNAKQLILGTVLGRLAMGARDVWIAFRSPADQYAMLLNDRLATELVVKLCPRGGHFIDVGAHIGSVIAAVLHLHHDRSIRVTAIEAVPAKARALQRKFPEVTVHACAVGSSGGEVSFFVNSELSGYSSLARQTGAVEIKTTMRRLDDLVDTADVVKIDVEGAELGVIQGAEQTIMKFRPRLVIEAHGLVNLSSLELRLKAMGMTISSNVKASSRPNETRWFVFAS